MNIFRSFLLRGMSLLGLLFVLRFAASESKENFHGYIDLRAALLVFVAPIFVLILFQKDRFEIRSLIQRIRSMSRLDSSALGQELNGQTEAATGQFGLSRILKFTENHPDSMVSYAGDLVAARFKPEEVARFLTQKIQAEDLLWQAIANAFGFLAKMAPYFGMLATVMGMIKLLENMSDFTKISQSMALAMQGTLYGLVSFTLVYSPIQKYLTGWREQALRRNEMIAKWFVLVAQKADTSYVREELRSMGVSSEFSQMGGNA